MTDDGQQPNHQWGPQDPGYKQDPRYQQQPGNQQNQWGPQGQWGPAGPPQPLRPEDQRLWATLTHISGIFLNFVGPLVAYLLLRDRGPFVREHTRVALNFHITMGIAYVASSILTVVLIGVLLLPVVAVVSLVFSIIAAVRANSGEFYRYPLSIEFIKQ